MPADSKAQQHLAGMALALKRGRPPKKPKGMPPNRWHKVLRIIRRMAESMTEDELREYARTKTKGLPERKRKR